MWDPDHGYRLREATPADLEATWNLLVLDEFAARQDREGNMAVYERAFAFIQSDPSNSVIVVTAPDGLVVGTLQLTYIHGLARGGALRAQIEAVRVHPEHRGAGLGTAMMRWAIDQAHAAGCALVQLTSDVRRERAHRFYTSFGFVPTHTGFKLDLSKGGG